MSFNTSGKDNVPALVSQNIDEAPVQVLTIFTKLPPFWPSDPHLWFTQVEVPFSTQGITAKQTIFNYIITNLSPEYARRFMTSY